MRFNFISFFVLLFFLLANVTDSQAQTAKRKGAPGPLTGRARTDSITNARKRILDSTREARAHILDSTVKARKRVLDSTKKARERALDSAKASRKHIADSIKTARMERIDSLNKVRKRRSDSLAAIREYRTSRRYRDSVQAIRTARLDSIRAIRQERLDSIRTARKEITDSITTARKERIDSIRAEQKHRSDSLAVIREYRSSKRYKDSVTLVRRHRLDSIAAVREAFRDSLADARKHILDSTKTARAHILDSTKAARTKYIDSIKMVRKARTDSLEKMRAERQKLAKVKEKKKQESLKMKLELKLKKKREAWSNESMLKKRWSPIRRFTQNSFTHYNYYFNARQKMREAKDNMLRVVNDDFDAPIKMYPFDPNTDSSLLAADMDSIVRKVSVGLQIHDPRTKWSNDMYLLLGKAYYYKGSYENAATSFRYIIASDQKAKNKKSRKHSYSSSRSSSIVDSKKRSKLNIFQHKSVHNDAILWLARTYTTAGQVENAESVLSLLAYDANLPESLEGKLAAEKAFAYLHAGNKTEASKQLSIAVDDGNIPEYDRMRMAFLNGQLLQEMGSYKEAAKSFEEVLNHYPKLQMDFYARKYIAYNKLLAGESVATAVTPLKRTLKDGKYVSYYDQVYYVLGNLAVKGNRNKEALGYFHKSVVTPKASRKQKALSFAAMGDVYYALAKYPSAKSSYDSAAKYSSAAGKDKSVAAAVQRSAGLNEISGPVQTIHDQDSLLSLAAKSRKTQQSIVRRQIRALEKKRDDSIFNAENSAVVSAPVVDAGAGNGGSSTSWYFSNPGLMTQGRTEFKRKWGNRKLADNWARTSAGSMTTGGSSEGGSEGEGEDAASTEANKVVMEDGIPTEESLLALIPNTAKEKETAIKTIQRSYVLLAKAYVKQLDDYDRALQTLDTLDKRFPNHRYKEEELFLRYEIAVKQNKLDKAQGYANELLKKFPDSDYAGLLKPNKSESKSTASNTSEVADYFDKTYDLLMSHQYTEVLMRTDMAKTKFDEPTYNKRFWVTEAMAYAGKGNYDMADTVITKFINTNPKDSLTDWAKSVKKYIGEVRNGGKPSWYKEGPPPKHIEKKKEKEAVAATKPDLPPPPPEKPDAPAMYAFNTDSAHYCVILLPGLDSRTGQLKKDVREFDTKLYGHPYHELLIDMYDAEHTVLLVETFNEAATANEYMEKLKASEVLKGYSESESKVLIISRYNYKKMFADKTATAYIAFYNIFYK